MSRWDGIDEFTAVAEQASFSAAALLMLAAARAQLPITKLTDWLARRQGMHVSGGAV